MGSFGMQHTGGAKPTTTPGSPSVKQSFASNFPVKAYILFSVHSPGPHNSFVGDSILGIGGCDGTRGFSVGSYVEDGADPSNTKRCQYGDTGTPTLVPLVLFDGAGNIAAIAEHSAFDDGAGGDGVTIAWTTNDATASLISCLMFGDAGCTDVYVGRFNMQTSTGTFDITDPGFQPDVVFFWWSQNGNTSPAPTPPATQTNAANIGFGWTDCRALGQGRNFSAISEDNITNHDTGVQRGGGGASVLTVKSGVPMLNGNVRFWDRIDGGFRMDQASASTVGHLVDYLAIRGGSWREVNNTTPSSTGNKAETGLGAACKAAIFASHCSSVGAGPQGGLNIGMSYDDGGGKPFPAASFVITDEDATSTNADRLWSIIHCLKLASPGSPATIVEDARVHSWDSDGLTVEWTTVDGTAREYGVLMQGDAIPASRPLVNPPGRLKSLVGGQLAT